MLLAVTAVRERGADSEDSTQTVQCQLGKAPLAASTTVAWCPVHNNLSFILYRQPYGLIQINMSVVPELMGS